MHDPLVRVPRVNCFTFSLRSGASMRLNWYFYSEMPLPPKSLSWRGGALSIFRWLLKEYSEVCLILFSLGGTCRWKKRHKLWEQEVSARLLLILVSTHRCPALWQLLHLSLLSHHTFGLCVPWGVHILSSQPTAPQGPCFWAACDLQQQCQRSLPVLFIVPLCLWTSCSHCRIYKSWRYSIGRK